MSTTATKGRDETLLTGKQVAARCGISSDSLYRLGLRNLGPEAVLTSKGKRYRAADVDRWNETREFIHASDDRYMTIAEARSKLRCSRWTIGRRIQDGDLIARKIGRSVWIDRDSVERYITRQLRSQR